MGIFTGRKTEDVPKTKKDLPKGTTFTPNTPRESQLEPKLTSRASKLTQLLFVVQNLRLVGIFQKVKRRMFSETISYCLRRDLTIPFEAPEAKIPVTVRPLKKSDIPVLLDLDRPELSDRERKELMDRLILLKEGIQTCYVAVDEHDTACYMQWLIGPKENLNLQRLFHGGFPWLQQDEALLEDAFTPESRRGLGIMSCAMAHIAKRGEEIQSRYVITFVHDQNIPSLKGCKRSGFVPYKLRREKNFFFRRSITFSVLPEGTPYPFDAARG